MNPCEAFEHELEIFRTEAEAAAQFFYAYLSVHETAGRHPTVFRLLNTAPLFWNTNLGALQTSAFIALGRIFDQDSPHNIDRASWESRRNTRGSSRSQRWPHESKEKVRPGPIGWMTISQQAMSRHHRTSDDFVRKSASTEKFTSRNIGTSGAKSLRTRWS